ncbi:unnamed protein product [Nesidiocoris tenuis]|uniref:Uncharacterized protein n=1 Tax=Nesidiocoris tenuis TaxID=355587 RepID=A0A6H5HB74_9HEMI|nr:unnamed protein product [Nesidiocoris tenuis]
MTPSCATMLNTAAWLSPRVRRTVQKTTNHVQNRRFYQINSNRKYFVDKFAAIYTFLIEGVSSCILECAPKESSTAPYYRGKNTRWRGIGRNRRSLPNPDGHISLKVRDNDENCVTYSCVYVCTELSFQVSQESRAPRNLSRATPTTVAISPPLMSSSRCLRENRPYQSSTTADFCCWLPQLIRYQSRNASCSKMSREIFLSTFERIFAIPGFSGQFDTGID